MVRAHMREHYYRFTTIEHLVIRDDLYDVHAIARTIGQDVLLENGLERWSTQTALVNGAAAVLAIASTNEEACRSTAQVAVACALCHRDAKVSAMFGSPLPPPRDDASVAARMARHVWATDRLSDGIIGAADDSWNAGLELLARTPAPSVASDARRADAARQLQELAAAARRTNQRDLMTRAGTYGEILVACSNCHTRDRAPSP